MPKPGPTRPLSDNPLFADTGLKLGLFGFNINSCSAATTSPDRHEIGWDQNVRLVRQAEKAGFEAAIPVSRWRGLGGKSNPWGHSYEAYTWAAALAALTERITVFSTSHCLTVSPVMAAKQISTIDAISHGRAALNVVAGWHAKELRQFGIDFESGSLGHDERYDYAEEWLDVVLRLWASKEDDEDVDFEGKHLSVKSGYSQPGPVQQPHPPVMNAAFSERGHRTAARYADIAFVGAFNPAAARTQSDQVRKLAAEYEREPQVWLNASVVCADTDKEAEALVEKWATADADYGAVDNFIEWTMSGLEMPREQRDHITRAMAATGGGYPLVGTAERIAEEMAKLADAGIGGIALTWFNYEQGVPRFVEEVMPVLEREGVRRSSTEGAR